MAKNTVRYYRQQLGMSQKALAEKLPDNLDAVSVGFIENGRVLPTVDSMKMLCKVFTCEPTDLYSPKDIDLLSSLIPAADSADGKVVPITAGSGRQHTGMTEFRSWMRPNEKEALNLAISQLGYRNSAEWFREMVRNTIARNKRLHNSMAAPGKHPETEAL